MLTYTHSSKFVHPFHINPMFIYTDYSAHSLLNHQRYIHVLVLCFFFQFYMHMIQKIRLQNDTEGKILQLWCTCIFIPMLSLAQINHKNIYISMSISYICYQHNNTHHCKIGMKSAIISI